VPGPPTAGASALVAPRLKTYADPVYPKDQLEKGVKSVVVLELSVDATGAVTKATVTESGGADFDAAALEAAPRLVFDPATRDGKPIPAKIPFRYTFDFKDVAKPKPVETVTPVSVVVLSGVVNGPTDEGLEGARVTVVAATGAIRSSATDAKGTFAFADLPPGKYRVRVEAGGFKTFEAEEEIVKGIATRVTYRPSLESDAIEIEVRGDRPPREVTKRVIDVQEIARIPGTNGDALRAVQNMPGVARPPGFAGILIIRGSGQFDTNVFVDGTLVPLIYHFGGLSSVIPTELIEKIDFFPGNFAPDYGRVMGGIIDVSVRSPKKDGYHGLLQFDLIDGRVLAEGPIDDKTRFAVAGRRSWVDVWLKPVLEQAGTGVSTAPVYYDYQVMLERDLSPKTTARLFFFGSDDRLAVTLSSPSATDPGLGGSISGHTGYYRLQGRTQTLLTKDIRWTNMVSYGTDVIDFAIGDLFFSLLLHPIDYRSDFRAKLSSEAAIVAGIDMLAGSFDVSVKAPTFDQNADTFGPLFARPSIYQHADGFFYRPSAYAMLELTPIKALKLLPGVRVDYAKDSKSWDVSPRFGARYDLVPEFPKTTLKGGAGVYFQPPQPQETILPFGTPGVKSNRSVHYSFGFEQELTKYLSVSLEGFYKDLTRLVVQSYSENATASGVTYKNIGTGHVYGSELFLRYQNDGRFFGWLSYTLSRSERRDAPGQDLHLFQFDQTHILTLLGSVKLGRGWQTGARFRYVTGSTYTPVSGGVSDFDAGAYEPLPGRPFSARLPSFQQLDVRIDKEWKFSSWRLSAYLDVQNVYNRQNPEGVTYNYNYTKTSVASGLPILPILGLRGEL